MPTLGAVAAATIQALGWLTTQSAALRPVWSTVAYCRAAAGPGAAGAGRQPAWLERSARRVWESSALQRKGGVARPGARRHAVGATALWPAVFGAAGGRA